MNVIASSIAGSTRIMSREREIAVSTQPAEVARDQSERDRQRGSDAARPTIETSRLTRRP